MPTFTKSTSFQTLETFQTMYITKKIPWHIVYLNSMCIFIKIYIISPIFTSKCQHGQYQTLKVEYLLPMPAFTKIIVLHNFRYKKLSKPCTQLLRYKQPVPYLPAWTIPYSNCGVLPMPAYTKINDNHCIISDTRNFPNYVYNY